MIGTVITRRNSVWTNDDKKETCQTLVMPRMLRAEPSAHSEGRRAVLCWRKWHVRNNAARQRRLQDQKLSAGRSGTVTQYEPEASMPRKTLNGDSVILKTGDKPVEGLHHMCWRHKDSDFDQILGWPLLSEKLLAQSAVIV